MAVDTVGTAAAVAVAILATAAAVVVLVTVTDMAPVVAPAVILAPADQDILHLKLTRLDKAVAVEVVLLALDPPMPAAVAVVLEYMVKAQMVKAKVVMAVQATVVVAAALVALLTAANSESFKAATAAHLAAALAPANQLQMKVDYLVEQVAVAQ
jgi:hypothetical protein